MAGWLVPVPNPGLFWCAAGYTCSGTFWKQPTAVSQGNKSISGTHISADSAGALKSITANISLASPAKTASANEQAGGHTHKCVSITFVLFSFSCLGNSFWFVFVCFAFLCSKSPVDDRLGSVTWPAEAELRDPTGRTQAARSASSNLCS